jgi:predicted amidohydrolase
LNIIYCLVLLRAETHFAQRYGTNPSCYTPGDGFPTGASPFGRVGHLICFDRHFPEVVRSLALNGATLVLNPSYGGYDNVTGPGSPGDNGFGNARMLQANAYINSVYYIFTNAHQTLFIRCVLSCSYARSWPC